MYDKAAVGRRIRSGIADNGLSISEFAGAMGVSRQCVYDWINGESVINFECATRICEYFNWPLDRLAVRGEYDDQALT